MNVVGRVGSLISQGVYSVATPFHPFGGAVDIIVVKQEDGTYRSTPWYVRFGKFQGVLMGAEKVVTIAVNGVEANFHMYLDNSGQAYFMREVSGSDDSNSNYQVKNESSSLELSTSGNFDSNAECPSSSYHEKKEDDIENSEHPYRFEDEQTSPESSSVCSSFGNYHYGSLDEVKDMVKETDNSNSEMVLISVDGHVLTAPISSSEENMGDVQLDTPQFHLGPGEGSSGDFGATADVWETGFFSDLDGSVHKNNDMNDTITTHSNGKVDIHYEYTGRKLSKTDAFQSCLDLTSYAIDVDQQDMSSVSTEFEPKNEAKHSVEVSSTLFQDITINSGTDIQSDTSETIEGNAYVDQKLKNEKLSPQVSHQVSSVYLAGQIGGENTETANTTSSSSIENMLKEGTHTSSVPLLTSNEEQVGGALTISSVEEVSSQAQYPSLERNIPGSGFQISLCRNLLYPGMGYSSADKAFEAHRISEEEFKASGPSIIKNGSLIVKYDNKYFPWDKAAHLVLGKAVFGPSFSIDSKDYIPVEQEEAVKLKEEAPEASSSRRWRLWPIPFRRAKSLQHSDSASSNELFVDSESGLQSATAQKKMSYSTSQSPRKQFVRSNSPTNEQIASLNLREGQNLMTFSFSTRVLGRQQVDAHIYLWKWNARIVISDVDGTITKSDVLGQFMPLVGKDWTQCGVAGLFSAIRENGYQLLFLSARAIVQAYLTRSFLLNLKQDGKALPSGPVVISPDGLFPSLYREVIRRAPHEFKIACLEDIRALFPSDYNPFYAGFGNRDTDELSYKKIGIPKGKIFIINPKGEVAINNCVAVKSYTSLHTLVHDMFPPTPSVEQEDFNSWNYWKMPLPNVEL